MVQLFYYISEGWSKINPPSSLKDFKNAKIEIHNIY